MTETQMLQNCLDLEKDIDDHKGLFDSFSRLAQSSPLSSAQSDTLINYYKVKILDLEAYYGSVILAYANGIIEARGI